MKIIAKISAEVRVREGVDLHEAQDKVIIKLLQTCTEWSKGEVIPCIDFEFVEDYEDEQERLVN